ncbi:hypothetical protein SAMN05428944_2496 [Streptomyces sp. 1222.5]|uniref:hypothetical protein n=1 Tax=unclassified Streptomyces TaxID=2593676 RepID=UPI00089C2B2D|nr:MULTISPECIES: hypothetical protein [unclassified Streptomyces]PKW10318.1 hypothetical protein BX260_5595 [Streptomyces sp. 5112.2]SEC09226.1 hypothetical protein SAMN05428944_2496 [Streptomyces sp. 1222.5]SED82815.1 hypothetical protein SAMN05216532_5873 [Streptomyces sp. 2231.1]
MRIRRSLAAVITTAALAGLGLTGAATATAATHAAPTGAAPTVGECEKGGGTVDWATWTCKGGTYDGQKID